MPRRYHAYPPEWQVLNLLSSAGASIWPSLICLPLFYLGWSHVLRPARRAKSVAGHRSRMADLVAAAEVQFRATPVVTTAPYQYDPEDGSFTTQDGTRYA